jgi:hypothetical protein
LDRGRIIRIGEADEVTRAYLDSLSTVGDTALALRQVRQGSGQIRFIAVRYLVNNSVAIETVPTGDKVSVVLEFECREKIPRLSFVCSFYDANGMCVLSCDSSSSSPLTETIDASGAAVCEFERFPLLPGSYRLNIAAKDSLGKAIDVVEGAAAIEVTDGDFYRTGHPPRSWAARVLAPHNWRILHPTAVKRKLE